MGRSINSIIKIKKKEIKKLRRDFDIGLIRNAAFSVGTEFYSPQVSLQAVDTLPLALPLLPHLRDENTVIENYQPFTLARALFKLRVPVLFVATDREILGGDPGHVNLVKTGQDISVVQRDFIIDEAQLYQAKTIGSDGLLLDADLLEPDKLAEFAEITFAMGIEPFLRVDDAAQLKKVEAELVGGLVLEKDAFEKLRKSEEYKQIRSVNQGRVPVLLIHQPQSIQELKQWAEEGIRYFLLPDNWLLQENPVYQLEAMARNFWPEIEPEG